MPLGRMKNRRWRVSRASRVQQEYLEIFHNRTRRHSSLGMLTPIEYEKLRIEVTEVA